MYRLEDTPSGTAPSITAAAVSGTPGTTTATVGATVNAGTAQTTVTFKYGTAEGTYNLNPASLSGGTVAANTTGATPSASLTGLTPGTTYFYQWTATNTVGSATRTGSFTASCFDAPTVTSNGTATNVSFTWNDVGATQYVLRVWRDFGGGGGTVTNTDKFTVDETGATAESTTYYEWGGKTITGNAYYSGNNSGGSKGAPSIQLRSNNGSGIVATNSGGKIRRVSLAWGSTTTGRSLQVYGSHSAYTTASNLYDNATQGTLLGEITNSATAGLTTTNLDIAADWEFVGVRSRSSGMLLESVTFEWETSGGGGSTTNYYGGATGLAATSGVSVAVLVPGEYNWKLVAQGGGTCSQTVTGTVTAASGNVAPSFSGGDQTGTVTVGNTYEYTRAVAEGYPAPGLTASCSNPDAAGLFSVNNSGEFTFTPTVAGTYQFVVTAANSEGSASYTNTVTASAGTPTVARVAETPLVASATVTADVSAMGAVATVEFVYGTTETYGTGGTVSGGDASTNKVAAGTSGRRLTATLANLIAGTEYFYKWTVGNGTHSATLTNCFTTGCFETVPTVTTNTGSLSATLSWPRMDGADHYLVSLWEGGAGGTDELNIANLGVTATGYSTGNFYRVHLNSDAYYAGQLIKSTTDSGAFQMRVSDGTGGIVSTNSGGTVSSVSVTGSRASAGSLQIYGSHTAYTAASELYNSGTYGTLLTTVALDTSTKVVDVSEYGSYEYIGFKSSSGTVYIMSIDVTWDGGTYATGVVNNAGGEVTLHNVTVAQPAAGVTPVTAAITSLAANTNTGYSWSVTAVGGGTCNAKTEGSGLKVEAAPAARVEVLAGDPLAAVADPFDFGTCEVVGGTVTKTFTVTNAGNAALAAGQLSLPTLSGTGAGAYSVAAGTGWTSAVSSGLAVGGTAEFTVSFDPSATMSGTTSPGGTPTATVSVPWGTGLANSFSFGVTATVHGAGFNPAKTTLTPVTTVGYTGSGAAVKLNATNLTAGTVTATLSGGDAQHFRVRTWYDGSWTSWGTTATLTQSGGTLGPATNQVRIVTNNTPAVGTYSTTLIISGGGAPDKSITINGTVYPMPSVSTNQAAVTIGLGDEAYLDFSDYHDVAPSPYKYTYTLVGPEGLDPLCYEFDDKTNHISGVESGPGDVYTMPDEYGVYAFKVCVTNQNKKGTNFVWTVTVADAPTIATNPVTGTLDMTLDPPQGYGTAAGTVNPGGADTTVTFEYRTGSDEWTAGTVFVDGVQGNVVASNATGSAREVSVTTPTNLMQATTYDYRWTVSSVGGTNTASGTFFVPGNGVEFPGGWYLDGNGQWITEGTTTRDTEYGGGNYYSTPARYRAQGADFEFKEKKGSRWYGQTRAEVYVNGMSCHYADTNNWNNNTLKATLAGYYTLRGWDKGDAIEYVAMYTENPPVTVTNGADDSATAGTGDVTVTAELSAAPSASEKVYVRYTTDGWATSAMTNMTVSGTNVTGRIPGQGKGTTVEWYILTSPHEYVTNSAANAADLCTLRGLKSGETNFCYTTAITPPAPGTAVAGYEKVVLSWALNAAGQNVTIVRYDGTPAAGDITQPADGTAYASGATLVTGTTTGTVVYVNWNSTGVTNAAEQGKTYTYVFYSVNGDGAGIKYSEGASATLTATTMALGTPTVLVGETGYVTWDAETVRTGEKFVVARCDGSDGFSGTPSGGEPTVGTTPFCGGKVVYVGTEDDFTDDEVVGCNTYYYKAWLKAPGENAWSAGSAVEHARMDEPGAVTVTGTNSVTESGFALTWDPVDRASGYLMSIWTGGATMVNTSATYTVSSRTSVSSDGAVPAGSAAAFTNSYTTAGQATSNNFMRLRLTGYDGKTVTGLKMSMKSNKDKGSGSLSVKSGSRTLLSFGDASFSSASWYGSFSTNYVTVDFSSRLTATTVGTGETFEILISANQNSLYCESFEIIFEGSESLIEYVSGYGAEGGRVTNNVAIGGMDPGTDYGYALWAVGATTACAGPVTTNTVHTGGTAKPNPPRLTLSSPDAGTIEATVTRANGEAWELWRFATAELAASATVPPAAASAGVVRVGGGTTPATGATTVTDTGLTGCTVYWYKAWEVNDPSGTPLFSNPTAGSQKTAAVEAPTGLTVVSTNASGASLAWTGATGASGYDVEVWHYGEGWGEPKTVVYTNASLSSVKTNGTAPAGSHATFSASGEGTYYYMEAGDTMTLTLYGWDGCRITGISLRTCSDTNDVGVASGGGSFRMQTSGGNTIARIEDSQYCDSGWYGAWETVYWRWIDPAVTPTVVGAGETVTIQLACSESWLWYDQCEITYETPSERGRLYDWENGAAAGGSSASVTVDGTTATVTGLAAGTEYGWSVAALGGDCEEGADGPDFETPEVVSAPTVTPVAGTNQVTGTVTGSADADTVWLYRFDDKPHADAAVLSSTLGGTRVTNVTASGEGSWTFEDKGLLGCTTYWYRAWLTDEIDGVTYTSPGSFSVSAQTELAVPKVTAVGAGEQMGLSWPLVAGATGYTVRVSSTNTFTDGTPGTFLSENFNTTKSPTGWSFSGTGWYDNAPLREGTNGSAIKFDGTGDSVTTPAFGTGATMLTFWTYGNGGQGTFSISGRVNNAWTHIEDVTAENGAGTHEVALPTTVTQLLFSFTKVNNCALDNVAVSGPSGDGTVVYRATLGADEHDVTAKPLVQGNRYWYEVTAYGSEGCSTVCTNSALTEDAPLIELKPKRWGAGTVDKGVTATNTFTVRNRGTETLTFTSADIVPAGTPFSIASPTGSGKTASIGPGESRTYVVTFAPTNSGTWEAKLRFESNAANGDEVDGVVVPGLQEATLTGTGYDPETAAPDVLKLEVIDGLGIDGTVWDHSLALAADAPVLKVTAWHKAGIWTNLVGGTNAATWTLRGPDGNVVTLANGTELSGKRFTGVRTATYGHESDCAEFSVAIPALGAGRAVRGDYSLEVTVKDASGRFATTATSFLPTEEESVAFDDFTRADVVADGTGKLQRGWTAICSGGATVSEAAIHDRALELYGETGTSSGAEGRIGVVRDMGDVGYATTPHEFEGAGSWGFHFQSEAQLHGWDGSSMVGAYVLGSTLPGWLSTDSGQAGLAVTLTTNGVQLVSFRNSLLKTGSLTPLGDAWAHSTAGKTLAVRVELIAGHDAVDAEESDDGEAHEAVPAKLALYVKEVSGTGGDPTAECGSDDRVTQVDVPEELATTDLPYGGVLWAHGTGPAGAANSARFDDIHLPRMDGQSVPMTFHCVDDDTKAPTFEGFSVPAAIAAATAVSQGLRVRGTILDPSGLWMDVSGTNAPSWETAAVAGPRWELWVNGAKVAEDAITGFAEAEDENGESTSVAVDFTIPRGSFDAGWRTTNCVVVVKAWDFDIDRAGDSLSGEGRWRFTLCDSTPTAPAWATVEADGAEMAVLRWAWTNGANYVVVRGDAEIGAEATPPQGTMTTPTTGSVYAGLGTVVYAGAGDNHLTNGWTAREILVKPGSANYFAVYGMSGGDTGYYFSSPTRPMAYTWTTTNAAGDTVTHWATEGDAEGGKPVAGSSTSNAWPCVMAAYEPGEGVDSFAYRTSVSYPTNKIEKTPAELALEYGFESRTGTGSGWITNEPTGWQGDTNKWKIHDGSLLTGKTGYPTPVGNKLYWQDTSSGSFDEAKLTRWLDAPESGDFFVAAVLNYNEPYHDTPATNKWIEIALVDKDGNDIATFGKPRWNSYNAAIQYNNGQYGGYTQYTLNSGHGNDYIVVGQLSRTDSKFRMWVYWGATNSSDKIPEVFSKKTSGGAEVSIEDASTAMNTVRADCNFVGTPADVAGIQLRAGSESGKELGHVYFDEVRFAATWEELMLFNEPEVESYDLSLPAGSGKANGTNDLGQTLWLVSDGALAHSDVGLNASFELYHRTGIDSASFQILGGGESKSNLLREVTSGTTAATGNTAADVALTGARGSVYGEWTTPDGGATGMAIPTNWISLGSNYVLQVSLHSTGGREAEVTSATDNMGGGATDLFFGEYGEGASWDKYVEVYNGTGKDVDLYNYYIFRPQNEFTNYNKVSYRCNDFSTSYTNLVMYPSAPYTRLSSNSFVLHHKQTVTLLNYVTQSGHSNRLESLKRELDKKRAKYLVMPKDVLDSNGSVPYLLVKAEDVTETIQTKIANGERVDLNWLDACGCATNMGVSERYIMSRKTTATHLPRSYPMIIDTNEWDFRRWSFPKGEVDDNDFGYTNFVATAGGYDRAIGLGGTMEFRVFDDDEEPPALAGGGQGGGLRLKAVEGDANPPYLPSTAGDRTYVAGGWSFTNWPSRSGATVANLTLEEYRWIAEMWPNGLTTSGGVSWSPHLGGADQAGYANVIKAGSGRGQSHVEFDGIEQRRYGAMSAKAGTNYFGAPDKAWLKSDKAWLGFDLDLQDLAEPTLSFGYMGGSSGFSNACVSWSATGAEGSFATPTGWTFSGRTDSTWTEWSQSLDGILPEGAGHVWFRVMLWDYGNASGAFWLDNIRLEGNPRAVRVTDEQLADRGVVFEVRVKDESGVDAGAAGVDPEAGAKFETGLGASMYRRTPGATNLVETVGEATVTNAYVNIQWTLAAGGGEKTGGFGKKTAQDWYAATQGGEGQLKVEVGDLDDDRAADQAVGTKNFGMLVVEDDDDDGPQIRMKTMKPRLDGVVGEWLFKEKAWGATDEMDGVDAGALGVCTTNGTVTQPRASLRTSADTGLPTNTYAVYQTGWQAGSKYWTATLHTTGGGKGFVTNISFWSKVGSVNAPTKVELWTKTGEEDAVPVVTNSLLAGTDTAWAKESEESTTSGTTIGVWRAYNIGLEGGNRIELPMDGTPVEIRLLGTGGSPKGIGASWFLWDLKMEGELEQGTEGDEESYTYKTDHDVASGGEGLEMEGSVWDEGSGLAALPTWEMTDGITGSGTVTFTTEGALSNRTTRALGAFRAALPVSTTYTNLQLQEYRGRITATDADNDRNSSEDGNGTNYDSLSHTGKFGFTVVDQDVTRPTAPTNVFVNGVSMGAGAPDRLTAKWSNKPEFTVTFGVAVDQDPSTNWTDTAWTNLNVAGNVVKTNIQAGVSGIGEYRVSLTTNTADGVAYSVAVTNGALGNRGFEGADMSPWECNDAGSGVQVTGESAGNRKVDAAEGVKSFYLRQNNAANDYPRLSQTMPVTVSNVAYTLDVDATASVYKRGSNSIVYAQFQFSATDSFGTNDVLWSSPVGNEAGANGYRFNDGGDMTNTWLKGRSLATKTLTVPEGAAYMRFAMLANGGGANVDSVALSVKKGDGATASMRYMASGKAAQGLNAKYLFAVDADDDRLGDALEGTVVPFHTAYDITPPTAVSFTGNETGASTDNVDDPTTQFDLHWLTDGVGPDRPAHTNHPEYSTKTEADRNKDLLSPWKTYRVYYRTYDDEFVKTNATSGAAAYIYANLVNSNGVPQYHDTNSWKHVEFGDPIEDTSSTNRTYKWINDVSTNGMRLYDLENDEHYLVVVVGVDKAGNEGPADNTSWTVNNTIKFSLIRGWHTNRTAAVNQLSEWVSEPGKWLTNGTESVSAIQWLAAGNKLNTNTLAYEGQVKKDYDLLSWDARSFQERPDNDWKLIQTVKTNWFVDDGGPTTRGSIRFYRASYKDRWMRAVTNAETGQVTAQTPLVSEEVYAQTAIPLRPGWNFVALHGVPYTNTLRGVFGGTNEFPGGGHASLGTCIDFYDPATGQARSDRYWMDQDGLWHADNDTTGEIDLSDTLLDTNLFTRAFSIELPNDIPTKYVAGTNYIRHGSGASVSNEVVPFMLWKPILQVPTNGFNRKIECGTQDAPKYNIVALRLPVAVHPSQMHLAWAITNAADEVTWYGMRKGRSWEADQIYTIDTITREPGHSCYCDSDGNWKFVSGGAVPGDYFKPNDVLVIVSKNGGDAEAPEDRYWIWEYKPEAFYALPHRHMQGKTE